MVLASYYAWIVQVAYETNCKRCRQAPKLDHPINHRLRDWIVSCLQKGWDPSMISGRMKAEGFLTLCAETIYQWAYTSAWVIPDKLYQYLRQGKKRGAKQTGRSSHRSKIPNRVSVYTALPSLAQRPVSATGREIVSSIPINTPSIRLMSV